jgi:hypothetical protein
MTGKQHRNAEPLPERMQVQPVIRSKGPEREPAGEVGAVTGGPGMDVRTSGEGPSSRLMWANDKAFRTIQKKHADFGGSRFFRFLDAQTVTGRDREDRHPARASAPSIIAMAFCKP